MCSWAVNPDILNLKLGNLLKLGCKSFFCEFFSPGVNDLPLNGLEKRIVKVRVSWLGHSWQPNQDLKTKIDVLVERIIFLIVQFAKVENDKKSCRQAKKGIGCFDIFLDYLWLLLLKTFRPKRLSPSLIEPFWHLAFALVKDQWLIWSWLISNWTCLS